MASIKVFDPVSVPLCVLEELQQLRAQVEQLRRENEHLRRENEHLQRELNEARTNLDQAQRQSKRQAAPFSKGPPKTQPKRPGRKSGTAHGRHGHRLPPDPAAIDEVLEAPLPEACPTCGGSVRETGVTTQYQTEIPRRPIIRQFNVHVGSCSGCARRVQGRHPLQTSDALGAAAAQIGPDAQAAVVLLNKTFGLSHI
jgi:transposase